MLRKQAIALLPLLLTGCALLAPQNAHPPQERAALEAAELALHIEALGMALHGTEPEQAATLAAAKQDWEQHRLAADGLRYALLLSMLPAPVRDPLAAQALLRDLLAREQLQAAGQRALAELELARLNSEFTLAADVQRLQAELNQERERARNDATTAALTRRLQAETDENARLRKALEEARAKLDAITSIERRYTDRPPNEARQP